MDDDEPQICQHEGFHNDVFYEVLAHLPAIAIIRFRAVCRALYLLPTREFFIQKHFQNAKTYLLIKYDLRPNSIHHILSLHDLHKEGLKKLRDLGIPLQPNTLRICLVGHAKGFICLSYLESLMYGARTFFLSNPALNVLSKVREYPDADELDLITAHGFGIIDEHLRIILMRFRMHVHRQKLVVCVFCSSSNRCTSVDLNVRFFPYGNQIWLKDSCHWTGDCADENKNREYKIVCFDMAVNSLRYMDYPVDSKNTRQLALVSGALGVGYFKCLDESVIDLWVMREYGDHSSWEMKTRGLMSDKQFVTPVFWVNDRTLIFKKFGSRELLCKKDDIISEMGMYSNEDNSFFASDYKESLWPLPI